MVVKKKIFYIVLPILILVLLISFILIYLMGWLGNTPKLNRYQSLIDICTVEKKVFSIDIKCDALIDKTEERDGKNCLDLRVVNKENTNISEIEVCESSKVLDISDPVLETDMKIPMHMVFEYTYLPPLFYGISHISMVLMEDREIFDMLYKLNQKEILIQDVRSQEVQDIKEKGYYYTESDKRISKTDIGTITFTQSKINKISFEEGQIVINANLGINGISSDYEFKESVIALITSNPNRENVIINSSNISEIDLEKEYDFRFVYLPKGGRLNLTDLKKYCANKEGQVFNLCDNDTVEKLILEKGIEEYVKESIDKLVLNSLISFDD